MTIQLEDATQVLRENHYKITKQRKAMLSYLIDQADCKYIPVTSIDQFMRQSFPNMSHNTIYRNIAEFTELGIVEKSVQGEQAAVKFQCDFKHEHHHHFVCQNCGKVRELPECPLGVDVQTELSGCEISAHSFTVYGTCEDCLHAQQLKE
ncbi:Fur family transcriptional regulator [Lentilactobacillus kribbianus]|uniref:Fur family transcriptional regulator n=1 Tax=Lentilactobacillus kribbianus TaxID=2729622 RepID=UPI001553A2E1|nr:Fur family transcriptional regulator [Lentilactobacillus kribbianus]